MQSETASSYGGADEDRWGLEIGGYSEDGPTMAPPPIGLFHVDALSSEDGDHHGTIDGHALELVLDQGWQEEDVTRGGGYGYSNGGAGNHSPASRNGTPPVPPKLYSLSDAPSMSYSLSDAPLMEPSWSNQSHSNIPLRSTSSSSVNSYGVQDPFSPGASTASAAPSYSSHVVGGPLGSGGAVSSGVETRGAGGHVKQRSLSGGSPAHHYGGGSGSQRGDTPSPTNDRRGGGGGGADPFDDYGAASGGRRLA